jgi:hypothetical protein
VVQADMTYRQYGTLDVPRNKQDRPRFDWVNHGVQLLCVIVPLTVAAFTYWQTVQTELTTQRGQIQALTERQITMQAQITTDEERRITFENKMADKVDSQTAQLSAIATDLALLRKELRH